MQTMQAGVLPVTYGKSYVTAKPNPSWSEGWLPEEFLFDKLSFPPLPTLATAERHLHQSHPHLAAGTTEE